MEDKKEELKKYLCENVNPIVQPMLEMISKEKPKDVLLWISFWISSKLEQRKQPKIQISSQSQDEEDQQFIRKLSQYKKNLKKKCSRPAISAEVFGQFNKKTRINRKSSKKSNEAHQAIYELLQNIVIFKSLEPAQLNTVIDSLQEFQTEAGQPILRQGEEGDMLFIVCSGEYECTKIVRGQEKYQRTYYSGQFFGELALMYNASRAATIRCVKPGILYGLDRQTFLNIAQEAIQKKRKNITDCIAKVGILADTQPFQKEQLCDALKTEQFNANQYVVRQGESGDRFYLVAEGTLIAQKYQTQNSPPKKVFDYQPGDYFGEIALIKNTVRQASIKTQTKCKLLSIDRDSFKRLVGPIEQILRRNMDKYKKYMDQ